MLIITIVMPLIIINRTTLPIEKCKKKNILTPLNNYVIGIDKTCVICRTQISR